MEKKGQGTPPNILFFLPDQHRADWLGSNPELPLKTPHLDQLCSQGLQFSEAYTPSPLCAPARACLASGMDYSSCRVPSNQENYPLGLPTYYQGLKQLGYSVAGVGKFDLHKGLAAPEKMDWGLDGSRLLKEWGFTEGIDNEGKMDATSSYLREGKPKGPYMQFLQNKGLAELYVAEHQNCRASHNAYVTRLPDDAYCDNWIASNARYFLHKFPKNRPWHLVVNFNGPHTPMDVTPTMAQRWQDVKFPLPIHTPIKPSGGSEDHYSIEDHQRNRRHYAAMIENIDTLLGKMLDEVERRGEMENTIIVYSSDHGEMLGDHGRWGKATWHQAAMRIPLIVSVPGGLKNKRTDALVSLHDLAATFLDYAGKYSGEPITLKNMDSQSFRSVLHGEKGMHRDVVYSALADWQIAYNGRYKLFIKGMDKSFSDTALYDLQTDPGERSNCISHYTDIAEKLFQGLKSLKNEWKKGSVDAKHCACDH